MPTVRYCKNKNDSEARNEIFAEVGLSAVGMELLRRLVGSERLSKILEVTRLFNLG